MFNPLTQLKLNVLNEIWIDESDFDDKKSNIMS
jgi:hypothetical protein